MNIIGVTNRKLCKDFYKRIEEISNINLKYLILREKDLSSEELLLMAKKIKSILENSKIELIINGDLEIAKKVGAYGVQMSFQNFIDGKAEGFNGAIGVSIHSLKEAIEAEEKGASFVLYGHVFETDCKKGVKPRGLLELAEICNSVKVPVYAIGGINVQNYKDVLKVKVSGIAVMSSLMKNEKVFL